MCKFTVNVERLVELLSEDPCDYISATKDSCDECPYDGLITENSTCFERRYADHLAARGVVAPPVDVGQKVWYIHGAYYNAQRLEPREIEVTEINKKRSGKTVEWAFIANGTRYKFSSIGKSVFLTKEACENEIKRRKDK